MARKPRALLLRSAEFRSTAPEDGDGLTLEGYAAVFNQDTEINSWEGVFTERIAPGAFKKTLAERRPIMQFDHGRDARTGSVPIGAFTDVHEDTHGLFVAARLHDNDLVLPIRQAIASGAISGMSFKFAVILDEWSDSTGRKLTADEADNAMYRGDKLSRTIREVALHEAGPVVSPAYAGTSVGVRDLSHINLTAEAMKMRLRLLDL